MRTKIPRNAGKERAQEKIRICRQEIQIGGNSDCMSEQNIVERIKIGSENVRKNHRATNQFKERYTISKDRLIHSVEF
jgi:hypothetical protein